MSSLQREPRDVMDDLGAWAQLFDPLPLYLIEYRQKGVMSSPTLRPLLGLGRGSRDPLKFRGRTGRRRGEFDTPSGFGPLGSSGSFGACHGGGKISRGLEDLEE
ncbi:hypothetical protein LIER_11457 [Lithospermum erythrorhizon]|uniref:Uncharacterized protein n=1 Tax=Lithospermum erythrorhizon TaxID=34254 RepID=A0AAV3PNH2_LITER